jgi:hypothetical protein
MNWPKGRGLTPRQDGQCVHQWQPPAMQSRQYQCAACGAQHPDCPHDWVWHAADQHWSCRLCGAHQPDAP